MSALGMTFLWCAVQVAVFIVIAGMLYVMVRSLSSGAGRVVLVCALSVVIVISGLAFTPWPRWERPARDQIAVSTTSEPVVAVSNEVEYIETVPAAIDEPLDVDSEVAGFDVWQAYAELETSLASVAETTSEPDAPVGWNWLPIAIAVCLTGMGVGFARLAAGLWAVGAYRKRGRLINDAELRELVDVLCAELSCMRRVELLEVDRLNAAGTVGWRRPVILLPSTWRSWTAQQRRGVLAHEIAHIRDGDFLTSLVAQFSLVLHFYNPLMHWLTARLRLEQELSADAAAAALTGGRLQYLQMLAAMALSRDERPLPWPARTFLPTRGHLIRRVEMLKHSKRLPRKLAMVPRLLLVGMLVVVGIGLVGYRGPLAARLAAQDQQIAQSDKRPASTKPSSDKFELSYIPSTAMYVIGIRPAALFQQPGIAPFAEDLVGSLNLEENLGLRVDEIEQITCVKLSREAVEAAGQPAADPAAAAPRTSLMVFGTTMIRAVKATGFRALIAEVAPDAEEREYLGRSFMKSPKSGLCYFRPDDRSIVIDRESSLKQFIKSGPAVKAEMVRGPSWRAVEADHLFVAVESATLTRELQQVPQDNVVLKALSALWRDSRSLVVGCKLSSEFSIQGLVDCNDESSAKAVQATAEAAMALSKNLLEQIEAHDTGMNLLVKNGAAFLNGVHVARDGELVRISSTSNVKTELMLGVLVPMIGMQQTHAREMRALNDLKHIGLAMHNYHNDKKRFPPAVVIGPDGKTPHSWRVALLPYFYEAQTDELYDRYRLDEPWDSPHNKQLIEKMPGVYGDDGAKNAAYFVFTGPGTAFGGEQGIRAQDIIDGTSNTLMVVEARRNIPWTKPEDIPYDPDEPVPALGGYNPPWVLAALFDGTARRIPAKGIPDRLWRAVISYDGNETDEAVAFFRKAGQLREKPAVKKPRARQRTDRSTENLKRIALAMHNYHNDKKRFPPAVVIGPDGKTPHSWRVALLPYLGLRVAGDLYQGYKLDEPWDSEHNKKLIEKMPGVYGNAGAKNTAYFVFTGPGTAFGGKQGIRMHDIIDGTSNTVMVVEAKRDIPWTKPEDIPYDPNEPVPRLGGYNPNWISAALFDGSALRIPAKGIADQLWRAAITYDGKETRGAVEFRERQKRGAQSRSSASPTTPSERPAGGKAQFVPVEKVRKNLRQIAAAMWKYNKDNNHFPAAQVIGPDGTTPHSWRVALLPYLGAADLYEQYRLDEPWDSQHNKRLIEKMPAVYQRQLGSTNTPYSVFTGPGTPFGVAEGVGQSDIIDGTTGTIMVFEAKRGVPWTKPEDIQVAPDKPFPKLGGHTPGGLLAVQFDGTVHLIPDGKIPEKLWRATITHAGRELEGEEFIERVRRLQVR